MHIFFKYDCIKIDRTEFNPDNTNTDFAEVI